MGFVQVENGQNSVISFVILKWLLPELSFPTAGQGERGLWERDWRARGQESEGSGVKNGSQGFLEVVEHVEQSNAQLSSFLCIIMQAMQAAMVKRKVYASTSFG